ncbi:MAG: FAD-dependent thymidylate synthase [Treponema sp.]|nr:FAD-dependent thymidylate synthase [Treponema sp.]
MAHCIVAEAESILDTEYKVLDKGFVRLIDYCGSDKRIVQMARLYYGENAKQIRDDESLIDYLIRHEYMDSFQQVVLCFHLKMPIFIARQWLKHRMGISNEISSRYSVMKDEFYIPERSSIVPQDTKQGKSLAAFTTEQSEEIRNSLIKEQNVASEYYNNHIQSGLTNELATINLPLSLYTEFYWQMDLHNLFQFFKTTLDSNAQYEIRQYAKVILEITKKVAPFATESFEKNINRSVSFNAEEMQAIKEILAGKENPLTDKKLFIFEEKLKTGKQL